MGPTVKAWHIPTIVTPVNSKVIGHPVAVIQLEMHVAYAKLQFVQFYLAMYVILYTICTMCLPL